MSLVLNPYILGGAGPSSIAWHTAFWAADPAWSNPGDGNAVSSWRDFSGNNRTASQGTGSKQPIYRAAASAVNNQPAVQFDGSDDALATASFTTLTQTLSVVAVFNTTVTATGKFVWDGIDGTNRAALWSNYSGTQVYDAFAGSDGITSTTWVNALQMIRVTFAGASTVVEKNGTSLGTVSAGTGGLAGVTLGCRFSNLGSNTMAGHIAFLGVYNGNVASDSNWSSFKSWVASYYGLTIA